ncbi:hypothetical protein GCM10023186_33670 [Hymenobacter koreensis]|uniref:KTSC domain-containing protein n=1 Tax=Hymenobacter koreensis TaxID=1084523 RepID=A0ABP8JB39_9BACT
MSEVVVDRVAVLSQTVLSQRDADARLHFDFGGTYDGPVEHALFVTYKGKDLTHFLDDEFAWEALHRGFSALRRRQPQAKA